MNQPALAPPVLVADAGGLQRMADALAAHPAVAVDTESNSLHAYRERVCLIQFSTPDADYIVDPLAVADVTPLARLFANPDQEKIFHAAEYDLIGLRRDYSFAFANIFDTMSAARTLGWPQVGLASILASRFGVTMNKQYQRADWKRRPLTPEQLDYARLDTHYLIALRDAQFQALTETGRVQEAREDFDRLARARRDAEPASADEAAFWRVKGAFDLPPARVPILAAIFAYREQAARRSDRPPFMVMAEATLMEIVRRAPRRVEDLQGVPGMTPEQIRRHGQGVVQAVREGLDSPPRHAPPTTREPDDVQDRFDRLHTWRKNRAKARGVESDVIMPRTALWDLARRPPRTREDLTQIADFGQSRREAYGDEILALLARVGSSSSGS